jgi:hypothetical protein
MIDAEEREVFAASGLRDNFRLSSRQRRLEKLGKTIDCEEADRFISR